MIKRYIIGLVIVASFIAPISTKAFSYSGRKWPTNGTTVDASDTTWPSSWANSLANSMSTWNNAGSSFRFSIGSGHKFTIGSTNLGAVATTHYVASGSTLTSTNTVFNQNLSFSITGEYNKYDVQNIATHELGHWLQLLDLYQSGDTLKTMYANTYQGELIKRTLETDDKNGIKYIYP